MSRRQGAALCAVALALAAWLLAAPASAAELRVVSSGGFAAALKALAPVYERESGDKLQLGWGPSMGETADAVPNRLARGEKIDVVVMVGSALDRLAQQGQVAPDSRRTLARSLIGVAVKAGAARPDISTPEALTAALRAAKSVAYSDSASGVYIEREMLPKLGLAEEMRGKARMIPAEPVGEVVARGEADIGFQQFSELKPVKGVDIVGPLPPALQKATLYAAGVPVSASSPEAGRRFIAFLASAEAKAAIAETGLEPSAP